MHVTRSVIAADELAQVIGEAYDLGGSATCRLRSVGDNDTYVVRAGGERYILRVYCDRYWIADSSHYDFELDWLVFLRERGLAVSYPIARRDGALSGAVEAPEGRRFYTLLSWAAGEPIYPMDEDQAKAFGRGIAEIQQASDEFESECARFSYDLDFLFVEPIAHIAEVMGAERSEDIEYMAAVGRRAKERIEELDLPAAGYGIVGGDYHGGNNHFAGNVPTYFDFDICGYGWKVYDLAVFYHNASLNGSMGAQWAPMLAGYESVRPLHSQEKEALVPFAIGRRIWRVGVRCSEVCFAGDQDFDGDYWTFAIEALRNWDGEISG